MTQPADWVQELLQGRFRSDVEITGWNEETLQGHAVADRGTTRIYFIVNLHEDRYLEYYATNRFVWGDRRERLYADGRVKNELETIRPVVMWNPKKGETEEEARKDYDAHNRRVADELREIGLYPQDDINTYLRTHDVPKGEGVTMTEGKSLAEQLQDLGVRGILITAAEKGLIEQLKCTMPECHCPEGETYFERRPQKVSPWAPSVDHIDLKSEGGQLTLENVRLAHVLCNRVDYARNHDIRYDKDLKTASEWMRPSSPGVDNLADRLRELAKVARDRAVSKASADQSFERGRVHAYNEMLTLLEDL